MYIVPNHTDELVVFTDAEVERELTLKRKYSVHKGYMFFHPDWVSESI